MYLLEILYFQRYQIHVRKWMCRVKLILNCFILLNLFSPKNFFPTPPLLWRTRNFYFLKLIILVLSLMFLAARWLMISNTWAVPSLLLPTSLSAAPTSSLIQHWAALHPPDAASTLCLRVEQGTCTLIFLFFPRQALRTFLCLSAHRWKAVRDYQKKSKWEIFKTSYKIIKSNCPEYFYQQWFLSLPNS